MQIHYMAFYTAFALLFKREGDRGPFHATRLFGVVLELFNVLLEGLGSLSLLLESVAKSLDLFIILQKRIVC